MNSQPNSDNKKEWSESFYPGQSLIIDRMEFFLM
jgi:hypothetical protein